MEAQFPGFIGEEMWGGGGERKLARKCKWRETVLQAFHMSGL